MATQPSSFLSSTEARCTPHLVDSEDDHKSATQIFEYATSGSTIEDTVRIYHNWAPTYDKDMKIKYNGPIYVSDALAEVIGEERREEVRVLDVAAGTGRVGLELARRGFRNLEALDPTPAMLELLKATQVYRCTYCEYVGVGQTTRPSNYYDAVVMSGGLVKGHIPLEGVDEFIRLCKPGGFICIAMTKHYLDKGGDFEDLEPYFKSLEQRGLWTKVSRKMVSNYSFKTEGLLYTYKVL